MFLEECVPGRGEALSCGRPSRHLLSLPDVTADLWTACYHHQFHSQHDAGENTYTTRHRHTPTHTQAVRDRKTQSWTHTHTSRHAYKHTLTNTHTLTLWSRLIRYLIKYVGISNGNDCILSKWGGDQCGSASAVQREHGIGTLVYRSPRRLLKLSRMHD